MKFSKFLGKKLNIPSLRQVNTERNDTGSDDSIPVAKKRYSHPVYNLMPFSEIQFTCKVMRTVTTRSSEQKGFREKIFDTTIEHLSRFCTRSFLQVPWSYSYIKNVLRKRSHTQCYIETTFIHTWSTGCLWQIICQWPCFIKVIHDRSWSHELESYNILVPNGL